MGKIRVKTLGNEVLEEEQKQRDQKRRAKKRAEQGKPEKETKETESKDPKNPKLPKSPTEPTVKTSEKKEPTTENAQPTTKTDSRPPNKRPRTQSKRHAALYKDINKDNAYELKEALDMIKKSDTVSFTSKVELHATMRKTAKEIGLKKLSKDNVKVVFERKAPLAHATIGTTTDKTADLEKSYQQAVSHVGTHNIKKLTLSSTMGPGIKIAL
jgi:hypothetical protein